MPKLPKTEDISPIGLRSIRPSVGTLRVGALAKRTGKTVRALHLYEELGLVEPSRSKGGYRLYAPADVVRVRWIAKLQDMGFSLPQIRTMVAEWERSASAPEAMTHLAQIYEDKLQETRDQLARLKALEAELESSIDYLASCNSCDPQRLVAACSNCDQPHCTPEPPMLVSGLHS